MVTIVRNSWPLFLGLLLLMAGNALQSAALGLRGADFTGLIYGFISSGYFAGFLIGSYLTPKLLQRVGHIRVFAALGSLISCAFILYIAHKDAMFWFALRVLVGFGFSGVYIVAESWLNSLSTNATRGKTLAAYMFIQYVGVVIGQAMLTLGDPKQAILFILMSVMVSISFAPILLSVTPAPVYSTSKAMSFSELFKASPLGFVGSTVLGAIFGVMFGMSSYYGGLLGITLTETALFLVLLYLGGAVFQLPVGWFSDRMDRRFLVIGLAILAAVACIGAMLVGSTVLFEVGGVKVYAFGVLAFFYGGLANPIYSALLAHTNDFLENDQMASAAGRFVFLNGLGAMTGPFICGFVMGEIGPQGFWLVQAALALVIAAYGLYRATQRPTVGVDETGPYVATARTFTPVAAEMAQEIYIEKSEAAAEDALHGASTTSEEEADLRKSREAVDHD